MLYKFLCKPILGKYKMGIIMYRLLRTIVEYEEFIVLNRVVTAQGSDTTGA